MVIKEQAYIYIGVVEAKLWWKTNHNYVFLQVLSFQKWNEKTYISIKNRTEVLWSLPCCTLCVVRRPEITDCNAQKVLHKLAKIVQYWWRASMPCQANQCNRKWILYSLVSDFICSLFSFGMAFKGINHNYSSMSSSPELWAPRKLWTGGYVSPGGLVGLSALSGVGEGHGVGGCRHAVCCLRCLCSESFSLRDKASSGGLHTTSSMQEWLLTTQQRSGWDKMQDWGISGCQQVSES